MNENDPFLAILLGTESPEVGTSVEEKKDSVVFPFIRHEPLTTMAGRKLAKPWMVRTKTACFAFKSEAAAKRFFRTL